MGGALPSPTSLADNARIRVLIVDDHQMVAESLAAALQPEPDIELVGIAGTALEAKRLAETERPDVVLMDFRLPDQDGAAATEAIKARRPETQVVMVTSADDEAVLLRCIEAGCSGFIPKDRPVRELVEAVRAVHAGEALVSSPMLARLLPRLRLQPRGRPARPDPSRARHPRPLGPGHLEPGYRRPGGDQPQHRAKPRPEHPVEAGGSLQARSGLHRRACGHH